MWPYWVLFLIPAFNALGPHAVMRGPSPGTQISKLGRAWIATGMLVAIMAGWRHEVGGDWFNYLGHWAELPYAGIDEMLSRGDLGYWLICKLFYEAGLGIYSLNLFFATLFSYGLVVFCRNQPRPWLALTVSVPYLVIVLGMGYTRQGVALGLAMVGMVALADKNTRGFVFWVALGALFHKSAVVLVPLGMLARPGRRIWSVLWVGAAGMALFFTLLRDSVDGLVNSYIDAQMQSEGALVRVLMNVVPAVILLWNQKRFNWGKVEKNLWTMIAWGALGSVVWLSLSPTSSTAVDRLALYLIPLQVYVFSRLPDLLARNSKDKRLWVSAVIVYYALVQLVWLSFAANVYAWIPYKFYPLQGLF
jgi:uncharacterized membrane protein YeaQ/YmgE (transglycosylase-associated protein family)